MLKDTNSISEHDNMELQEASSLGTEGKRKRKRISFADTVQSVENNSEAIQDQKKKKKKAVSKTELKEKTLAEDSAPTEVNNDAPEIVSDVIKSESEEVKNDLWTKIVEDSKASGTNYEDGIKTILLEKLLGVVNSPSDEIIYKDYVKFMADLCVIFEKLRRFPKMISKFLYCVRTEVVSSFEATEKPKANQKISWTDLVLPSQFMASIAPAVSLLPSGQILDLWKTLHHNLDEECIKKIVDGHDEPGVRIFFAIVVTILTEFMASIKVSDMSVPITQIEKIVDLMVKLKDDCLTKLGMELLKRKHNSQLVCSFLKLSYTWAELHALLLLYNAKYKVKNEISTIASSDYSSVKATAKLAESTSAFNLTVLHPYLDTQSWILLGNIITKSEDPASCLLLAKLVAQKMKYMRTLKAKIDFHGKSASEEVDNGSDLLLATQLKAHLEEAAEFLWLGRWKTEWMSSPELDNVFVIASECLDLSKIIQLANNFVENFHAITKTKQGGKYISAGEAASLTADIKEEEDVEMTEIANKVTHNSLDENKGESDLMNSFSLRLNDNPTFCTAVLLELTKEIFRRLVKMKLEKKFIKTVTNQVFSDKENKNDLVTLLRGFTLASLNSATTEGVTVKEATDESDKILHLFLDSVNNFIENRSGLQMDLSSVRNNVEFSPELVKDLLWFVSELPLDHYSKEVKSFLTLFAIPVFMSIAPYAAVAALEGDGPNKTEEKQLSDMMIQIIAKCALNSKGNTILFGIQWTQLLQWFTLNTNCFSIEDSKKVLRVILYNIYISAKSVEDFQSVLYGLCEKAELNSSNMTILLTTLEFLIEEYATSAAESKYHSNTKLAPFIESHSRKLTHLVVELLAREKEDLKTNEKFNEIEKFAAGTNNESDVFHASTQALVRLYRSCFLARKALKTLSSPAKGKGKTIKKNKANSSTTTPDADADSEAQKQGISEDFLVFKSILPILIQSAMAFLKKFKTKAMRKLMKKNGDVAFAKDSALEFLHSICEGTTDEFGEELPPDFMQKLWSICMKGKLLAQNQNSNINKSSTGAMSVPSTGVANLPKHIYQVSGTEEFQMIADSIIEEINSLSTSPDSEAVPDEEKLAILTGLVDKLVEAELVVEKKQLRRQILETYLNGFLISTLYWKDYSVANYLPVLDLQLKIGRRRNTMCSVESLANCLVSVTAVPLKTIENVSVFRNVFCKAADLLNAFTMHRLDVVSFRTHIHLQCFQFLVECLTLKADQKNKLTDGELLDLRYCAHSIERVCQSVKLGQKEFARVSPYFLAVLMRQLDMCTVYPAVKSPLMNGCNRLLDLCDDHGVAQLNSMLSAGSREIFKTTYDLYKKFYRYTGKV